MKALHLGIFNQSYCNQSFCLYWMVLNSGLSCKETSLIALLAFCKGMTVQKHYPCLPLGCRCLSSVSLWPPLPLEGDRVRALGLLELLTPMEALRWPCRNQKNSKLLASQRSAGELKVICTCPGLGLVADLLGRATGSDWVMVLSLLARNRGWEWSRGRGSVWALSFRLGTNLGDSKKGTDARHDGEIWSQRSRGVRWNRS